MPIARLLFIVIAISLAATAANDVFVQSTAKVNTDFSMY